MSYFLYLLVNHTSSVRCIEVYNSVLCFFSVWPIPALSIYRGVDLMSSFPCSSPPHSIDAVMIILPLGYPIHRALS